MKELAFKQTEAIYFNSLTGIRAIAAFLVYFHHFNPVPKNFELHKIINELHIGVTLFFVLSGFLIALRYLDSTSFSFINYIINRFARIYPMYFLLTTLTFIVIFYNNFNYEQLLIYGLNISMLRGYFENFKFSGIAQGWSLTIEETFYFLAPFFFLLIKRSKTYLILLPILFTLLGIILVFFFSKINFFGFFSSFEFMFNYTFFGRCSEFFVGIGLALIYKNDVPFFKNFKHFTLTGILGILISLYLLILIKGDYDFGIRNPVGKIINTFFLPIFGISMLYYGLIKEQTWIARILSNKLFIMLGKSSYIFYLIHMGIFESALSKLSKTNPYLFFSNFIILNIVSILLYKYLEEPMNNFIRKLYTYHK